MNRLKNLATQLTSHSIAQKDADDVVICSAVRTPITKAKRGGLKDTAPEVMLSTVLKEVVTRANVEPKLVEDIAVGNNLAPGANQIPHRMGMLMAGFPDSTSIVTINRLCSSGLETCSIIAAKIKAGVIDVGIGAGVESMSMYKMTDWVDESKLCKEAKEKSAPACLMPMGVTSENVAERFGISRTQQDQLAMESHQKAARAQEQGLFKDEIVPVKTSVIDSKGESKDVTVIADDGIRK